MKNINLKHLRYFWTVAANGSIASASEILHLTLQTVSGQLSELEYQIGIKLFQKAGRNLVLTEAGRMFLTMLMKFFASAQNSRTCWTGATPVPS